MRIVNTKQSCSVQLRGERSEILGFHYGETEVIYIRNHWNHRRATIPAIITKLDLHYSRVYMGWGFSTCEQMTVVSCCFLWNCPSPQTTRSTELLLLHMVECYVYLHFKWPFSPQISYEQDLYIDTTPLPLLPSCCYNHQIAPVFIGLFLFVERL